MLTGNLDKVEVFSGSTGFKDAKRVLNTPEGEGFIYASKVEVNEKQRLRIPFIITYGVPSGFTGNSVKLPITGDKRIQEAGFYNVIPSLSENMTFEKTLIESSGSVGEKYDFAVQSLCSRDERRKAVSGQSGVSSQASQIDIGYFRRLNIFSEPFQKSTGVSVVKLNLPLKTSNDGEVLFVRVHDPAVPSRLWNQFAFKLNGFDKNVGSLELEIDFSDLVLTGDDRLWIDIGTAGKCIVTLGNKDNPATLSVKTIEVKDALKQYAVKEMVSSQSQYSKMYEYMAWKFSRKKPNLANPYSYGGSFDIIYPALALKRTKPDDFLANFMEKMSGPDYDNAGGPSNPVNLALKTFSNPLGAPEWAVYMHEYNKPRHKIADWWVKRQNPDGQIGGGWNDDTLFLSMHMGDLPLDCSVSAKAIIDTVHTKFEKTGLFKDGFCQIQPIDRMHTGDFISERYNTVVNNLGQAYVVEREMESARRSGHPEITPINYGNGGAFLSSVNVLYWLWGYDVPQKEYTSRPIPELAKQLHLFASSQNEYTFYRYTGSYVHTDDYSPYGSYDFYRYLLGGDRGSRLDAHLKLAVIWPFGGGPEMSRIVTRASDTLLEFVCYSFNNGAVNLGARLCRITDGVYKITVMADPSGNGQPAGVISETTKTLRRFDTVSIPIPPHKPLFIKISCVNKTERKHELPDIAVDSWDVKRSAGAVTVKIHNIGNASCENLKVRLIDQSGVYEDKTLAFIEAPTDFVPKTATLTFTTSQGKAYKLIIDPDNECRSKFSR